MTENYEKLEKLGEGTYGVVYKVRDKRNGKILALKKVRLENEQEGVPPTTVREVSILKSLKHSTIIDLIDVSYSKEKLFMIFEYVETDLRQLLDDFYDQEKLLPYSKMYQMAHQLMSGIDYCHRRGILHRDLKPQNILVNKSFDIKIADFGLGRTLSIPLRTYSQEIITLWYRAPELLLGCKYYAWPIDMWSIGCIFVEFALYKPIFTGDSEIDQLYKIFAILGTPNDKTWPNFKLLPRFDSSFTIYTPENLFKILPIPQSFIDLICKLLVYNPVDRITAKDALKHEFFMQEPQDSSLES